MKKCLSILIENKYYEQRTPNSKVDVLNLDKEKIDKIEEYPEKIKKIIASFREMEQNPSEFFDYQTTSDGIKILKVHPTINTHIKIPQFIDGMPVVELDTDFLLNAPFCEQIILPETINKLNKGSFQKLLIKSIDLPKSIVEIPSNCFSECSFLFDIDLSNVKIIRECAFLQCFNLKALNLRKIEEIEREAFEKCTNLRNVLLPDRLLALPFRAFANCMNLNNVILPNNLIALGDYCFLNCCKLDTISFSENLKIIGEGSFESCIRLINFTAPSNLLEIRNRAFKNSGLEVVKLNKGLRKIEENVFKGCECLETVQISNNTSVSLSSSFDFDKLEKIKFFSVDKNIEDETIER